jgi:Fe2+ transport system protein FeoA
MSAQPLSSLSVGQAGEIVEITDAGDTTIRLLEMGLVPGTLIAVVKRAPMGDPLELRVRGYHISLRKAEAAAVMVSPA